MVGGECAFPINAVIQQIASRWDICESERHCGAYCFTRLDSTHRVTSCAGYRTDLPIFTYGIRGSVLLERAFSSWDWDTISFDASVAVSYISMVGVIDLFKDIKVIHTSFLVPSRNLFACRNWSLWAELPRKLILQRYRVRKWFTNNERYRWFRRL